MSDAPPPAAAPDLSGTMLGGRYHLLKRLGAGGMGTVYLAERAGLRKRSAIKILKPKSAQDQKQIERFLREARATSAISHPNVIEISDFGGTDDGTVFFVMECLEGEDLRVLLKREKRLAWPRVQHLIVQVCRALEAAHAAGVVHRDMKPDNCFRITRAGDPDFIKVIDFGIAKTQELGPEGKGLTKTGMIIGTAEYMSPEQIQGNSYDPRVDVYAVGMITYELLCGRVPFKGKNFAKVLIKQLREAPMPPSQRAPDAGIPPEAEAIVLKALSKDPNNRFQTMTEMIAALEAVGTGAAAVVVPHEQLLAPEASGPMGYSSSSMVSAAVSSSLSSGVAPVQASDDPPEPGSRTLWIGLAGLALAAGLAGIALLSKEDAPAQPEAVIAAAPSEAAPAAIPEPAPAAASVSTLHFDTDVPVDILDPETQSLLGRSDDPAGLQLPRASEPVELLLHAEGYEDQRIEVIPSTEAKRYSFEMRKLEADKSKTASASAKSGKRKADKAAQPEPTPTAKPGGVDAEDIGLLNPFSKKK